MKERPILMNAAMVRATLAGTKTQTRRPVKFDQLPGDYFEGGAAGVEFDGFRIPRDCGPAPARFSAEAVGGGAFISEELLCPHGAPGDRLWVRENFQPFWAEGVSGDWQTDWKTGKGYAPSYPATDGVQEFLDGDDNLRDTVKPSIHMPRWASRIQLEVTGVRVERLQDISDADIEAEGIDMEALLAAQDSYDIIAKDGNATGRPTLRGAWRNLWESTGGDWDANPWLWVIEFKRVAP